MLEFESRLHLAGMYTGARFPDAAADFDGDRHTALGTYCPLPILTHYRRQPGLIVPARELRV
jgi:hypothetical protein